MNVVNPLPSISHKVSDSTPLARAGQCRMPREFGVDAVVRIDKSSCVSGIFVHSGSLWITGTPGTEDILLQGGDEFGFASQWPYVLQSLTNSRVAWL